MNNFNIKLEFEEIEKLKKYFQEKAMRNYEMLFNGFIADNEFKEREREFKEKLELLKTLEKKLMF